MTDNQTTEERVAAAHRKLKNISRTSIQLATNVHYAATKEINGMAVWMTSASEGLRFLRFFVGDEIHASEAVEAYLRGLTSGH
jgi:hypothetical protein